MKVEIKGATVALLVMDDTIASAGAMAPVLNLARSAMAMSAKGPTDEQRRAWETLAPEDRVRARDACTANVPALLTIEDGGAWSVSRNETVIRWNSPTVTAGTREELGRDMKRKR